MRTDPFPHPNPLSVCVCARHGAGTCDLTASVQLAAAATAGPAQEAADAAAATASLTEYFLVLDSKRLGPQLYLKVLRRASPAVLCKGAALHQVEGIGICGKLGWVPC